MHKKMVALVALAAAFIVAPAASAVAEPYTMQLPTETVIEVTSNGPGVPITIVVRASANHPTPPEGDIKVSISADSSAARGSQALVAAPLFTTTVHFVDEPIEITGPALPRGSYLGTASLTPDNGDLFLPSSVTDGFRIGTGDVGGESEGDGESGGLPNTGGPNVMWLILGSGLVAAGAGGVGYGRRHQHVAV